MFAKLPASKPCCCGISGTWNSVVGGTCGTCPTGVPPPPPLGVNAGVGWNQGVHTPEPVALDLLNGLTPLISEPGVTSLPVRPPVTKLLI